MAYAEIALAQIKALRQAATPRSYEVWYTYATGYDTALNRSVNETLARNGTVTDADLVEIYANHMSSARLTDAIGAAGGGVARELDQALALVGASASIVDDRSEDLGNIVNKILNDENQIVGSIRIRRPVHR